ncbi:MAG: four helix bundle protein [bacterium]
MWNDANSLALAVKRLTSKYSKSEHGSLRNQMVRAAESIADNIAEGCGAATNTEFARYLDIAIKSTSELENQLERSYGYGLTRDRERASLVTSVCDLRKMTWGLRKKVLAAPQVPPDNEKQMANNGQQVGKHATNNE